MKIEVHPEVAKVISFMERNVPARELTEVARAIGQIADVLWERNANWRDRFAAFQITIEEPASASLMQPDTKPQVH
jgi:hypothetical protein